MKEIYKKYKIMINAIAMGLLPGIIYLYFIWPNVVDPGWGQEGALMAALTFTVVCLITTAGCGLFLRSLKKSKSPMYVPLFWLLTTLYSILLIGLTLLLWVVSSIKDI